jgi:hypothetical protein
MKNIATAIKDRQELAFALAMIIAIYATATIVGLAVRGIHI